MSKPKKYQEVNAPKEVKKGQLRVWHIPQVPMHPFLIYVSSITEAKLVLVTLAEYDLFQLEYKIKPDYSNVQGLEVFNESDDGNWTEWEDEEGNNIDDTERT